MRGLLSERGAACFAAPAREAVPAATVPLITSEARLSDRCPGPGQGGGTPAADSKDDTLASFRGPCASGIATSSAAFFSSHNAGAFPEDLLHTATHPVTASVQKSCLADKDVGTLCQGLQPVWGLEYDTRSSVLASTAERGAACSAPQLRSPCFVSVKVRCRLTGMLVLAEVVNWEQVVWQSCGSPDAPSHNQKPLFRILEKPAQGTLLLASNALLGAIALCASLCMRHM
jgi:hypothetical protein